MGTMSLDVLAQSGERCLPQSRVSQRNHLFRSSWPGNGACSDADPLLSTMSASKNAHFPTCTSRVFEHPWFDDNAKRCYNVMEILPQLPDSPGILLSDLAASIPELEIRRLKYIVVRLFWGPFPVCFRTSTWSEVLTMVEPL